ncbi:MAG: NlpC/P60 family protein [Eubacterium sp.]|nr:NlpC/P60 family protein [Eubacterium sp.]
MNRLKIVTALGLATILMASTGVTAFAEPSTPAETQAVIDEIHGSISTLETQMGELTGQMDDLQVQLVSTIASIDTITGKIDEMTTQLQQTTANLQSAQRDQQVEYEAMKKRIQYLYEEGGDEGWMKVFMAGANISDVLDQAQYTQQMYDYDRDQLEAYMNTVQQVTELQQQQEEEKAALETKKSELQDGQNHLQELIDQARATYDDCDARLAQAYDMAASYQQLLDQQNAAIAQMIAAQQAQAEAAAAAAASASDDSGDYYYDGGAASQEVAQEAVNQYYANGGSQQELIEAAQSNGFGSDILAYAAQFLGNPYVYGGNSLTNGVDCSGFVQQVYSHFGISTSRTSWDMESEGQEVSFNDIQVGDVVCYEGHVGIYAGGGQIINAADPEQGITYTNADYDTIKTIRRYY